MSAFESIKQGLEEAKAFSKGQGANAAVHEIAVPEIDVSEIRAQTGLSQVSAEFVSVIVTDLLPECSKWQVVECLQNILV